eukprot:14570573-Ditylum_brightwellii.AAC.1
MLIRICITGSIVNFRNVAVMYGRTLSQHGHTLLGHELNVCSMGNCGFVEKPVDGVVGCVIPEESFTH